MFRDVQLAFFDYDRTLYVHEYPHIGEKHESYYEDCVTSLLSTTLKKKHDGDKPVNCMKWLVKLLRDNGVVVYVLTHEVFNLRDELKQTSAERDYGIANYLTVDCAEHKVDMIKAVARVHDVSLNHCLLVDDKMSTVYDACAEGIFAIPPINVAQMYEEMLEGRIQK